MPVFTNHHLTAEHVNDKSGPAVMLTQQEGIDDAETIIIHPWQLVAACQHLGLTASDPKAAQDIATLQRRMLVLQSRVDHLNHWLHTLSDSKHADLSYEQTYSAATADIAEEFCADFIQPDSLFLTDDDKKQSASAQRADATASPRADRNQFVMEM